MDYGEMMRPVRFGAKPQDAGDVPRPYLRSAKDRTRRLAQLREAADVLAVLPGEGESLHGLMTGRYDLAHMLESLIDKLGRVDHLRIATLSFNRDNARIMRGWIDNRTVDRLTVLCSSFFRDHNPEIFQDVLDAFASAGPDFRIAAARNHCKVVCMAFADGGRYVLEGSANLRTNSNREQFVLVQDAVVHDWHAAWIDHEVSAHAVNQT